MLSGHGAIIEIWLMVVWNSNTNVEAIALSYMTCLSRQTDQAGMGVSLLTAKTFQFVASGDQTQTLCLEFIKREFSVPLTKWHA